MKLGINSFQLKVSTDAGVLEEPEELDSQREVMVGDRTIEIFVGKE